MAIDIQKSIAGNPIKNGTTIVSTKVTGPIDTSDKSNTYVLNTPAIGDIESKYQDRFDDVGYYCLGSATLIGP